MHLLIVAATPFEIAPFQEYLNANFRKKQEGWYVRAGLNVEILITGVGMMTTAFVLGKRLSVQKPQLMINAGVAGTFHLDWKLGTVVQVISETIGDLGAEDQDGSLIDLFDLGLTAADEGPFKGRRLLNLDGASFNFLPKADGLTVNKVHGSSHSIDLIRKKYKADIESMEGAAFFYAALSFGLPFLALRALSNFVEPRNRESWQLAKAIDQLNQVLIKVLNSYQELIKQST